jgi:hypothetical protein
LWYGARADIGAPIIAALGFIATGVAIAMRRARVRGRSGLLAFAWTLSLTLLVLIPDARALAAAAYLPVFILGAPFGWPPADYAIAIPWPVINQYLCIVGGLLWGATALAFSRRTRGVCAACGRGAGEKRWTSRAMAARWGRWATYIAVGIPLVYATVRLSWAAGIPLGISDAVLREALANGQWQSAAALGTVALVGALLTLGLISRWGEVFPRWVPILGGRRVPPTLAIVPAAFVAALVTAAGFGVVRSVIVGGFVKGDWAAAGPALVWPVWGVALGAATLAYYLRRRGPCERCGRS